MRVKEAKLRIEGLTLLKGVSSAGKSSCIKAVYAALANRFDSDQVRWGEENAVISLRWSKESPVLIVQRNRQGGSPLMKLNGHVYSKLNRNLPKEVQEYNNLGVVKAGSDTLLLNFQAQFQKPLLLEFSNRRILEILSASKGMDDLNLVSGAISKKREQNRGAFKSVSSIINSTKGNLSVVKFNIQELEPKYNQLKQALDDFNTSKQHLDEVSEVISLAEQLSTLSKQVDSKEKLIVSLTAVYDAKCNFEQQDDLRNQLAKLFIWHSNLQVLQSSEVFLVKKLKSLQHLLDVRLQTEQLANQVEQIEEVINQRKEYGSLQHQRINVDSKLVVCQKFYDADREKYDNERNYSELSSFITIFSVQKSYNDRLHQINNILENNLCPLCGKPLADHE